jgi:hypothetical protein
MAKKSDFSNCPPIAINSAVDVVERPNENGIATGEGPMRFVDRSVFSIFFSILVFCLSPCPAHAGCGLDPICAISQSIGRGAGGGFADSVRPLVTDVMEREAPALIAQLQTGMARRCFKWVERPVLRLR